jgi:hypothetical protein
MSDIPYLIIALAIGTNIIVLCLAVAFGVIILASKYPAIFAKVVPQIIERIVKRGRPRSSLLKRSFGSATVGPFGIEHGPSLRVWRYLEPEGKKALRQAPAPFSPVTAIGRRRYSLSHIGMGSVLQSPSC